MEYLFSKRIQATAVVAVMCLAILLVIQVFGHLLEVFMMSGPTGVALSAPIAAAAGLFAWVAKDQLGSEEESPLDKA